MEVESNCQFYQEKAYKFDNFVCSTFYYLCSSNVIHSITTNLRKLDRIFVVFIVSISLLNVICFSEGTSLSPNVTYLLRDGQEVKVSSNKNKFTSFGVLGKDSELISPLRIATCRATCLQKFSNRLLASSSCFTHSDCFTCWKSCELLDSLAKRTFKGGDEVKSIKKKKSLGTICSSFHPQHCKLSGCQVACGFYQSLITRMDEPLSLSVAATKRANVLHISSGKIEWPQEKLEMKLAELPNIVYVLIQQYSDLKWRQITQTTETSVEISNTLSTQMANKLRNVRLLVVSPNGLVSIFYPQQKQDETVKKTYDIIETTTTTTKQPHFSTTEKLAFNSRFLKAEESITTQEIIKHQVKGQIEDTWDLKKISLVHQNSLVIAELTWNPIELANTQQYLITWELDGGGLKGHLVTDSTSVCLSLWSDTLYHIQVELFTSMEEEVSEPKSKSFLLTVDTSEASFPLLEKASALNESVAPSGHKSVKEFLNVSLFLTISSSVLLVFGLLLLAILCYNFVLKRRKYLGRDPQLLQDTDDLENLSEKSFQNEFSGTTPPALAIISPARLVYPAGKVLQKHNSTNNIHFSNPSAPCWWQNLSTRESNNHYNINNRLSTKINLPSSTASNVQIFLPKQS